MTGLNRAEALNRNTPTERSMSTGGGSSRATGGQGSVGEPVPVPLSAEERDALERAHPDGVQLGAILTLLEDRGVRISEATFRKYVQLGLLPRSRRVGRKGKHRGSHGLYPVDCVSRVVEIKTLMEAGLTLEEIQRSALAIGAEVDLLRRTAESISQRLELALAESDDGSGDSRATRSRRKVLARSLAQLRGQASELVKAMEQATIEICALETGLDSHSGSARSVQVDTGATPSSKQTPENRSVADGDSPDGRRAQARSQTDGALGERAGRGTTKRDEEQFE